MRILLPIFLIALATALHAEQRKDLEKIRPTLDWHRDPDTAFAEARETGKPVLLVFR